MTSLTKIKAKELLKIFAIPFIIEIIFIILASSMSQSDALDQVHALWMIGANAVLFVFLFREQLYEYYLNSDTLVNILPFKPENVITITTLLESIFYLIFNILGQVSLYIKSAPSKVEFSSLFTYSLNRWISILSILLLLNFVIIVFKNIQQPTIGILVIISITALVTVTVGILFWRSHSVNFNHYILGISPMKDMYFIYLNVLPIGIYGITKSTATSLQTMAALINCIYIFVSILGLYSLSYIKKNNYIDLLH